MVPPGVEDRSLLLKGIFRQGRGWLLLLCRLLYLVR